MSYFFHRQQLSSDKTKVPSSILIKDRRCSDDHGSQFVSALATSSVAQSKTLLVKGNAFPGAVIPPICLPIPKKCFPPLMVIKVLRGCEISIHRDTHASTGQSSELNVKPQVCSLPALVVLPVLVGQEKIMAVPGLLILLQCHMDDGCVVLNPQIQEGSKVLQVTHHGVSAGEEVPRVVSEQQPPVVAQKRIPVVAEVELAVGLARVLLVDADEFAVPRVEREEAAGSMAPLKDDVVPAGSLEEIGRLQARGPGPDDAVVVVQERGPTHRAQAAGVQGQPQERSAERRGHGGAAAACPEGKRTGRRHPRGCSHPTGDPRPHQSSPRADCHDGPTERGESERGPSPCQPIAAGVPGLPANGCTAAPATLHRWQGGAAPVDCWSRAPLHLTSQ